jgi:uncharacterized protein (DUF2164 family)
MTMTLTDQERCELAARVFRDLLKEHELTGFFLVSAEKHGTHGLLLDESAPWCRLRFELDSEGAIVGMRVRSKLQDYRDQGLSESDAQVQQQRDMEGTIGTLEFMVGQLGPVNQLMHMALDMLRERFEIEHHSVRVGDGTSKGGLQ